MFYLLLSPMWFHGTPSRSIITIRDVKACIGARIRRMRGMKKNDTLNEFFVVEIQTEFECFILLN